MAREIHGRLRVTGMLELETALAVAGIGDIGATDAPLAVDGQGRPYVPGTSLAGALRGWTRRAVQDDPDLAASERMLWGPDADAHDASASAVIVEHARVVGENARVEQRDGVGIDRYLGTAADDIKYDREVLPAGTQLELRLTVELPVDEIERARRKHVFGSLLLALERGDVPLGAGRTRGLGRVRLVQTTIVEDRLDRTGVLAALRRSDPYDLQGVRGVGPAGLLSGKPLRPAGVCELEITLEVLGPMMVAAGAQAVGVDVLPLTSRGADGKHALVLPGSSVKGALRARAELIVRTVLGPEHVTAAPEAGFGDQVDVPLVRELFGAAGVRANDEHRAAARGLSVQWQDRLGLGALGVSDTLSTVRIEGDAWRKVLSGQTPQDVRSALESSGLGVSPAVHVAIDRWTGGAKRGALYSVLELHDIRWETIKMRLDLDRIPEPSRIAALALLWLVLRDVREGRVPLGFGTHRGLGDVRATSVKIAGDVPAALPRDADSILDLGADAALAELRKAWKVWLQKRRAGEVEQLEGVT